MLISGLGLITSSCEKIIEIELNEADVQTVIEAKISDESGENKVILSKSGGFYQGSDFEKISGAAVSIADDSGNSWELTETSEGFYTHPDLTGINGERYSLHIEIEEEKYSAVSELPSRIQIDSVFINQQVGPVGNGGGYVLGAYINDPAETADFYRIKIYKKGEKGSGFLVFDDGLINGNSTRLPFFLESFESGDEVVIEVEHIDEAAFEYFNALSDITGGAGPEVAAPGNPVSNISNDALGYFSAYSLSKIEYLVP